MRSAALRAPLGHLLHKRIAPLSVRQFHTSVSLRSTAPQTSTDFFREALSQDTTNLQKGVTPVKKSTGKISHVDRMKNIVRAGMKEETPEAVDAVLSVKGSYKYMHLSRKLKEGGLSPNDMKRATACIRHIKGSPYKLAKLCNQVRGLSYHEAVAQMQFSKKALGWHVKRVLDSARYNAENIYNLNPDRLLVDNIWAGKGLYIKRTNFHGRGRLGVLHHPHCHVSVVLREVPERESEARLGRFGKTHKVVRRQMQGEEEEESPKVAQKETKALA